MNIIVIGLGKIGQTIIENVAKEGHNIVAIDDDSDLVNSIIEQYDINGVVGSGVNYDVLKQAEIENADLVIAVTSTDEINIMACLLAKSISDAYTIARVRDPQYFNQVSTIKNNLGISMILNPEYETAKQLKKVIELPDALNVEPFADGEIEVIEIIIETKSKLLGKSLLDFNKENNIEMLIGAVIRKNKLIIPKGDYRFQIGDRAFLVSRPNDFATFFAIYGLIQHPIYDLMIVAGSKIAYYFAKLCEDNKKYHIKIFERKYELCEWLTENLKRAAVIYGDGTNHNLLIGEGLMNTNAFVALTGNDEVNMILSLYAQQLGIKKVFAKVNKDNLVPLLGNDTTTVVLSPRNIVASQITSYIRSKGSSKGGSVSSVYRFANGAIEAIGFDVKKNFKAIGVCLKDMKINSETLIVGIIRDSQPIIPNGNSDIRLDDKVVIITTKKMISDLNDILEG